MLWNNLTIGILGSLIAAFIFLFLTGKWLPFSYVILRRIIKLHIRLKSAGLSNFYRSRIDYKYRGAHMLIDYLSTAEESIDIAAYWMAHGNEAERIAEEISGLVYPPKKLKITIAIVNPHASYIEDFANYLGIDKNELLLRIKSTLK